MKKQLRKPENWQDFESLCKILWGEIWNCPEIKKNGRTGQTQHGVDVYGTPDGKKDYYGIQCKGKDDYTNSQLSESEINEEIAKAKNFKPKLKKFYFATTANKDAKIEEYIRLKDEEFRKNGDFEIHLFSWEDIVDLIDENRRTHDWYVANIGFKIKHSVEITFDNGESHLEFAPKLLKNHVKYRQRDKSQRWAVGLPHMSPDHNRETRLKQLYEPQPTRYYINGQTFNLSSCVFRLLIVNNGNTPIENIKMYIKFPVANIVVDTVSKQRQFLDSFKYSYNTFMYQNSNDCVFEPSEQILVQTDKIITDRICLRPTIEEPQEIVVDYEFVAKDFNKKGQLTIKLDTTVDEKHSTEETDMILPDETRLENYFE
ncbi:MAG: hypothetical protein KDE33_26905 [Bacteroidetes bacterium]|nr:hypothetical protein [Bacteroidota bacterium]